MTFPKPAVIGRVHLKLYYRSYIYQETNQIQDLFAAPCGQTYVNYHTVSSADAIAESFVAYAIPGAVLTFAPSTTPLKILAASYLGYSLYQQFQSITGWYAMPTLSAGQFYKTTQYYGYDYTLNTTTQIWTDYASYSAGISPIYTGYSTYNF